MVPGRHFLMDRAIESRGRAADGEGAILRTGPVGAREPICLLACQTQARIVVASASTLSPRRGRFRRTGHVVEVCWMHTDTSGGARDTEVNELAAIPTGVPSTSAQTVIPDGKHPNARRN